MLTLFMLSRAKPATAGFPGLLGDVVVRFSLALIKHQNRNNLGRKGLFQLTTFKSLRKAKTGGKRPWDTSA